MSRQPPERHFGYVCRQCGIADFMGRRYACWACIDYQICGMCFDIGDIPITSEHKYYHPLETHYTRAEYQLYFGGEPYLEGEVPQSYMCAFCHMSGYTIRDLYHHLADMHRGHPDFEMYFSLLYARYTAETTPNRSPLFYAPQMAAMATPLQEVEPELLLPPGRCLLEIIRPGQQQQQQSIRAIAQRSRSVGGGDPQSDGIVDQALDLLDELQELNVQDADYVPRSSDILLRARELRRSVRSLFSCIIEEAQLNSLSTGPTSSLPREVADVEVFIRMIEQEVGESTSRLRDAQLVRRRGGLVPGSNAAAAASSVATTVRPGHMRYPQRLAQVRPSTPSAQGLPPLPPAPAQNMRRVEQSMMSALTGRRGWAPVGTPYYQLELPRNSWQSIVHSSMGLVPAELRQVQANINQAAGAAARGINTRATMMRQHLEDASMPSVAATITNIPIPHTGAGEIYRHIETRYSDIVREMATTHDYRPVLLEVLDKLQTRNKSSRGSVKVQTGNPDNKPKINFDENGNISSSFLCAQFSQVLKTEDSDQQKANRLLKARFTEALICSMLAEEQLPPVQCSFKKPQADEKLKVSVEAPQPKAEDGVASPVEPTSTELALMKRFYKGLDYYKCWLDKFAVKRQKENQLLPQRVAITLLPAAALPETRFAYDDDDMDDAEDGNDDTVENQAGMEESTTMFDDLTALNGDHFSSAVENAQNPIIYIESDSDPDIDDDDSEDDDDDGEHGGINIVEIEDVTSDDMLLPGVPVGEIIVHEPDDDVDEQPDDDDDDDATADGDETDSDTSDSTLDMIGNEFDELYGF